MAFSSSVFFLLGGGVASPWWGVLVCGVKSRPRRRFHLRGQVWCLVRWHCAGEAAGSPGREMDCAAAGELERGVRG